MMGLVIYTVEKVTVWSVDCAKAVGTRYCLQDPHAWIGEKYDQPVYVYF
jgi:hypothetical protein